LGGEILDELATSVFDQIRGTFSPSNHLSRKRTGYGPTDSYAGFSCCFRMTPRTCSERLPAMRALSAQLFMSTIIGFIELREALCATTPRPRTLSGRLACLPSRTLRARRWRRGCPAFPNQGLVKSLAGQREPASRVESGNNPSPALATRTGRMERI